MSGGANPHRGEAVLKIGGETRVLRPTFTALVAAEQELGPLLALVERAADGRITLTELAALFWHCLADQQADDRGAVEDAIMAMGLTGCALPLRAILTQILKGGG